MSRDPNHLAHLNSLNDAEPEARTNDHAAEEEDLSIFQNTNFYDFDIGRSTNIATTVDELLMQQEMQIQYPGKSATATTQSSLDITHASFQNGHAPYSHASASSSYHDLTQTTGASTAPAPAPAPAPPITEQGPQLYPFDFSELQEFSLAGELPPVSNTRHFYPVPQPSHHYFTPGPNDLHHVAPRQHRLHEDLHPEDDVEPAVASRQAAANRHESSSDSLDEVKADSEDSGGVGIARQIADEDKRRRNTAASARFRIKKKLREQEMERNTRQMQARIDELESKLKQLEMENRWLKNLVVERNEKRDVSEIEKLRTQILGKSKE